jgi:dipeptidyl aminopeptidase/acylaminoacyl peptidase
MIVIYDLERKQSHTIIKGGNDFKNLTISDDGAQVAFVAERDAKPKDLQRFYKLWYYKEGMDSALMIADRSSVGMRLGLTISEFSSLDFSRSGQRLFFGTTAILPPRDTSLIDIDIPKVDIWHYNDDYLQTVQNFPTRLRAEQQRSFLAVFDLNKKSIKQLATRELPQVITTNEGDGDTFIGITDFGKRVESQWVGVTRKDIYAINPVTGENKLIKDNLHGQTYPSSTGKYIVWFDRKAKNYFSWDGTSTKNISSKVKVPLWSESDEVPDDPGPYGIMKWSKDDDALFVYDKYGVWKLDPTAKKAPILALDGRKTKSIYRYVQLDPEERYIESGDRLVFRKLNDVNKNAGLWEMIYNSTIGFFEQPRSIVADSGIAINQVQKALKSNVYLLTKESFTSPADLYTITIADSYSGASPTETVRLSFINPQQKSYNWGNAELVRWKAYDKKDAVGILYKPEDFNPKKKYPMIIYFYEDLSNNLNNYYATAPIRSAINIPFFVSRGYIIFLPDIHYTTGHPGRDAYNYIVSGARAVVKKGFVDSTRMALQGHSWGGYQAAQVVTMTKLFKAAWAGAPVANMTSAYGGIRWESGVSRQWQYEKSQSRIGATLWEKPELYIENSPLFHLNKVTTPIVIMANDADGAVPWYQGIELFTGLRRLGKKVWMFNYNGQGHGLTQRQDMRDYQIRMQQFFDWILKDQPPAKWITEGLPATKKGKELGLEL